MADFYGCLESSSFRVKDKGLFLGDKDVQKVKEYALGEGGFFDQEQVGEESWFSFGWCGEYPGWVLQLNGEDPDEELDITDIIQRHILPKDVCRIGVSGNEKLRYIGGGIVWITSKGTAYFDGVTEWDSKINVSRLKAQADHFLLSVRSIL